MRIAKAMSPTSSIAAARCSRVTISLSLTASPTARSRSPSSLSVRCWRRCDRRARAAVEEPREREIEQYPGDERDGFEALAHQRQRRVAARARDDAREYQIGRAPCRERVCKYV